MIPASLRTAAENPAGGIYTKTTRQIKVTCFPMYLIEQSAPDEGQFVWAYTIRIENLGAETVQLIDRSWRITDADGQKQAVDGPGVVGEQPTLEPGQNFQYTSGTVLPTSSGLMAGSYGFEKLPGRERFEVVIPAFSLDSPSSVSRPN